MDLQLAGRVYVVTGGTKGLGLASAQALVEEGAHVLVSSRSQASVDDAVSTLGDRAEGLALDNADPLTAERLAEATQERFGRIDGAVISVGGPAAGPVTAITDDEWRDSFESVFLGAIRTARTVAGALHAAPSEGGSIVFVLSTSVKQPVPDLAISNGLRPGLAMAAKHLADELGPLGIRVNGLLPGRIDTDRVKELDDSTGDADAARQQSEAAIPLRRYGRPEEFGRAAAMLLSPALGYIDGVMLAVDGGLTRAL